MYPPSIRVGVDESPASRAALKWAAVEAVAHDVDLLVTHAYDWRILATWEPLGGEYADMQKARAEALVDTEMAEARAAAPGVRVRGEVVLGAPGPALVVPSGDVGLTVVGNRGRGGFANLLVGSVAQQVAVHSVGSVVVVRAYSGNRTGPIVVGVDGSPAGDYALGVAFAEADARETKLVAVRAYAAAAPPWWLDLPADTDDPMQRRERELRFLVEDVAPWRDKYPDVDVESVVVEGRAGGALVGLSSSAQLIVVGTRGHGGFTGLLLGSVGLQLLHHAECPVLIVRRTATR